ncbi:oxygen-binding di-iron domain-containing protein [Thiosocius teredinicola]|uniref:MBL fold metallo-hydrolase n=1 Tax=Thiosocius teredinicola TaxID=1973002 RepID=UPI0009910378
MAIELFNDGNHVCVAIRDLASGEAVQANQFLIYDSNHAALIDPGGEFTYTALFLEISKYMTVKDLDYVIASHQDPDIVASLNKWLVGTNAKIVVPELWERFIPHFTRPGKTKGRIIGMPDKGMNLELGGINIKAIPAHFLHAEGNFQFYDPKSKILFSGDLGANLCPPEQLDKPAESLNEVMPYMEGFHRRYMNSNRVCRFWANMAAGMDINMLVPQHGRAFTGKAIKEFIVWISELNCGIDLIQQSDYQVP